MDVFPQAAELFDVVQSIAGVQEAHQCRKALVSEVSGGKQDAHVDHVDFSDLSRRYGKQLDFLDLGKQSISGRSCGSGIVPTFSIVLYFNNVGGITFPYADIPNNTIAGRRGRIIMFQNYIDCHRPMHNPLCSHYGSYFEHTPKRIMTLGILANSTSEHLHDGLIYCPGTADQPLAHDEFSAYMEDEWAKENEEEERRRLERMKAPAPPKAPAPARPAPVRPPPPVQATQATEAALKAEQKRREAAEAELFNEKMKVERMQKMLRELENDLENEKQRRIAAEAALAHEQKSRPASSVALGKTPAPAATAAVHAPAEGRHGRTTSKAMDMKEKITNAFRLIDANGDGKIDRRELRQVLMSFDPHTKRQDLDACLRQIDVDKDGKIDLDEFMTWMYSGAIGETVWGVTQGRMMEYAEQKTAERF